MIKNFFLPVILLVGSLLFSSCLSRKKVDYFQTENETEEQFVSLPNTFEPVIVANDILNIQVASINPEASRFFNPTDESNGASESRLTSYLVDINGEIELPLLGKVKVAGLTTRQIRDMIRTRLEKYLESPTVKIAFESYKITLLGEVKVPGLYQVKSEKISITEALGLAGDLTIYGDRKKIMIIREQNDKKEFHEIDLTKRDIFKSGLFYLHPGDIVYVPAGKGRIASADAFYRVAPLIISTLTLLTLIVFRY